MPKDQELIQKMMPVIKNFLEGELLKVDFLKQLILVEPSFVELIDIFKENDQKS